jgi:hypothetical protein
MLKAIVFITLLLPILVFAQSDIMVLKKRGKHIRSFTVGDKLDMGTVYGQSFQGTITAMRHDSIFLNGQPWHFLEIAVIRRVRIRSGFLMIGTGMMFAAGGILVLGAVNGLLRQDNVNEWYTQAGLITSGVLLVGGFTLRHAFYVKYRMGKKYRLQYIRVETKAADDLRK